MFNGSLVALITPFKDDRIDEDALRRMVEWQIEQGTHGLVPVGTTGESPTLSEEEHKRVIEIVVEQTDGRVKVLAGAGSNNPSESIEYARCAEQAGADGVLVVVGYYNRFDIFKLTFDRSANRPISFVADEVAGASETDTGEARGGNGADAAELEAGRS